MKTNRIILVAVLCGVLLGGCTRDDGFRDTPDGDAVNFTAGIAAATRTTGGGDAWMAGDAMGVFMLTAGGNLATSADVLADNVQHKVTDAATGALAPESGTQIYYPLSGTVDFISYYPYRTAQGAMYDINLSDQTDPAAIDVLYAKTTGMSKAVPAVRLEFGHVLSKVTLDVKAGTGVAETDISNLAATDVELGGMPVTATLDLQDGVLTAGTDPAQMFNPLKNTTPQSGFDASFTALLVPQPAGGTGRAVTFTVGGQIYIWSIPDTEIFEAGVHYIYPVTVQKTGIEVGTVTIIDWNTNDNGTGTAEQIKAKIVAESNCYIVEPNGTSILIPISRANKAADPQYNLGADATGLGGVEADNFTVELVWGDLPVGAHGVIKDMFPYKKDGDGYVYVKPGVAGNAVICIRDRDSGTIKWSWHIWVTEPVGSDLDDRLEIRWMDRALGAKSHTPWVSGVFNNEQWKKTLGLFYQWGRKDAFPGSDGENNNQTYYTPAKPSGTTDNPPTGSFTRMYMMTQNPHIFASNVNTYYGSLYVIGEDNKSWNNDGFKTIYDPCPVGWMVPPHKKRHSTGTDFVWGYGFKIINNNLSWTFADGYFLTNKGAIFNGVYNATTLNNQFYPMVGGRTDKGEINSAEFQLSCWWSSKPDNARSIHLHIEENSVHANHPTERNSGFSIRCISE